MKFWKPMLLTAFTFIGISFTILFSACEKDSCTDLTCYNGGACSSGVCHCTSGYEGSQCQIRSVDRFLGTYVGVTTCDTVAGILDTVQITLGGSNTQVNVYRYTSGETLTGYISITGGQYLISIQPKFLNSNTIETFSISWLSNKLTFLNYYLESGVRRSACTFLGNKK